MTSFGRYTLVRRVGTGGMAEIWKAKVQGPAGFEKVLAIKKVLPHLVEENGSNFVDMFIEEAKLVAGLVHPNIVQVFDFGKVGKREYFIAMEYVSGANLARVIHRLNENGERMPPAYAVHIVAEAARGLGHAHAKTDAMGKPLRIVHRDISPQNVLLSSGGEVKVTDFGIAKVASALSQTAEGHVRGKLAYMSPEQARALPLDQRSDLFSLGIVLWELLAGRRLFGGRGGSDQFAKVMGYRGLVGELLDPIPGELRPVLSKLLAVDAADRFQDAVTLEAALSMHLGGASAFAARQGLAGIVQRLFADDLALETTLEPALESHMGDAGGTGMSGASVSGGAMLAAATDTVVTPSKSQQTLNPPPRGVGPTVVVATPSASIPARRDRRGQAMLFAGIAGGLAAAVGIAFFAGRAFDGRNETPAAASPIAAASATATAAPTATAVAIVTATPAPAATRPRATPVRTARPLGATPVPTAATPAPTRRPTGSGFLTVTARPWCEVWLDGKRIARETPLQGRSVPAGPHVITFKNSALGFTKEYRITVEANEELALSVDVKAGTVKKR